MKIPYCEAGDTPNNALNREWINKLVYAANAFLNMKACLNGKEYHIRLTDNGSILDLTGIVSGSTNIIVSTTGSVSGSVTLYDRSDVWQ